MEAAGHGVRELDIDGGCQRGALEQDIDGDRPGMAHGDRTLMGGAAHSAPDCGICGHELRPPGGFEKYCIYF